MTNEIASVDRLTCIAGVSVGDQRYAAAMDADAGPGSARRCLLILAEEERLWKAAGSPKTDHWHTIMRVYREIYVDPQIMNGSGI